MAAFSTMAALALTGVGVGMQAYGKYKEGKQQQLAYQAQGDADERSAQAQARAAEANAELAEYNAAIADIQAKDTVSIGELEANKFRSRTKGLIGEQRAGMAAGNIDVGYGSAVDVVADAAFLGELDALTVRTNAAREAWGYRVEAADSRMRGDIMRDEAKEARRAGRYAKQAAYSQGATARSAGKWGAITSVVGGATSLLEARYGFGRR